MADACLRDVLRAFQADPEANCDRVVGLEARYGLEALGQDLVLAKSWVFDREVRRALKHVQVDRRARVIEPKRVAAQMHLWFRREAACRTCSGFFPGLLDMVCAACSGRGMIATPPETGDLHRIHGGIAARSQASWTRSTTVSMLAWGPATEPSILVEVNEGPAWEPFSEALLWNPDDLRYAITTMAAAESWAEREAKRAPGPGEVLFKI